MKTDFTQVVFNALGMINQTRADDRQIPLSPDTSLYGPKGHLDSMDLVSLLVDIEDDLADSGFNVSLSDDKAMSRTNSPFLNINTLVNFIEVSIKERDSSWVG
ncbi:acyl carrier protein [Alteromonas sp. ASW11-19]|uniref:Acyl carrier protein n=1 Tax=Alteromonas salexigens TaxID=2982530 RepID=A0ABT2VT02_9ALTE|nr:acyl carrier protein [Alteromonas salexigens]MCU7555371.1 acyl carrier protein [Alteromonas salexigens]